MLGRRIRIKLFMFNLLFPGNKIFSYIGDILINIIIFVGLYYAGAPIGIFNGKQELINIFGFTVG